MTRRLLLIVALAAGWTGLLAADSERESMDVVASLASALTEANPSLFLDNFDRHIEGYEKLRQMVTALVREAEVECSIAPVSNEGDDQTRTLEVEWTLTMKQRDGVVRSRREHNVKLKMEKAGKHWRIVSIDPQDFFAPPAW
jgi:hypothetical protein